MAALTQVLETTELLENILVFLPTKDLLLSQRVSKKWHNVVNESITLQRMLFFEPERGEPLSLASDESNAKKYWVRLGSDEGGKLLINPLLDPLFENTSTPANGDNSSLVAGLPPAWRDSNASWRRMLPAQPAIRTSAYIGFWALPQFWCAWQYTEKTAPLFSTSEVRMGQIFDELDEKYGRFPYGKKKIVIVGLDC